MNSKSIILRTLATAAVVTLLTACGTAPAPSTSEESQPTTPQSPLYPEIEPFTTGHLKVSELHEIYYELSGNQEGEPVLALHGGPGVGSYPMLRHVNCGKPGCVAGLPRNQPRSASVL